MPLIEGPQCVNLRFGVWHSPLALQRAHANTEFMPRILPCLAAIALPLTLAACASAGGDYPSLAIRDAERASGSAMPVQPAPVPPPPPIATGTSQRIAQALDQARKAHASFVAGTASAARIVSAARGARARADSWIAAQVALADLQSLRSQAVIAQADVELMFAQERLAEPDRITPTAQALGEARERIGGWVNEQNQTLARLADQVQIQEILPPNA